MKKKCVVFFQKWFHPIVLLLLSVPNYLAKRSHVLATFRNVEYGISSLYFKLMVLGYGVFIDYWGTKFCSIFQEILIELIYWLIQHISIKKIVICIMYLWVYWINWLCKNPTFGQLDFKTQIPSWHYIQINVKIQVDFASY